MTQLNHQKPNRQRVKRWQLLLLLTLLILTGCGQSSSAAPTPTLFVLPTPTVVPATPQPMEPSATPDEIAQVMGVATSTPSQAITATPVVAQDGDCTYDAALVSDITVPDDSLMEAEATFVKTWRVRNSGTCSWEGVQLAYVGGADMAAPATSSVPAAAPGEDVDIAVRLRAPRESGQYVAIWHLQTPDGRLFGERPYVRILVQAPTPVPEEGDSPYSVVADTGCTYDSEYVEDITIPDDTVMQSGESFTKTWLLRNSGTCDWPEGTQIVFSSGNPMGAPQTVPVPPAAAGQEVEVSVTMTAPVVSGTISGWWRLQTPEGTPFGIFPFVRIVVPGEGEFLPAAPTPSTGVSSGDPSAPTATPRPLTQPSGGYWEYIHMTTRAAEIFVDGQTKSNNAARFTTVGDSLTDTWAFLRPIGNGRYQLHEYGYLQGVINYFSSDSFRNRSLASVAGWSSFDVLEPDKVEDVCPAMTPIACELRISKPAVVVIMIGTNDATGGFHIESYQENLREIVETSIGMGVIPILSTIPYDQYGDEELYNRYIVDIAQEYYIPWMDYRAAAWDAPNHGISHDGVHPSVPPRDDPTNFTATNLQYGYTIRNLLVLHALDAVWRQALQ